MNGNQVRSKNAMIAFNFATLLAFCVYGQVLQHRWFKRRHLCCPFIAACLDTFTWIYTLNFEHIWNTVNMNNFNPLHFMLPLTNIHVFHINMYMYSRGKAYSTLIFAHTEQNVKIPYLWNAFNCVLFCSQIWLCLAGTHRQSAKKDIKFNWYSIFYLTSQYSSESTTCPYLF